LGEKEKKLAHDPSAEVYVEDSEKSKADMCGLTAKEAQTILSATLAPFSNLMSPENAAVRRWVPWLCTIDKKVVGVDMVENIRV
jgi:hypothetical protein